MEGKHKVLKVQ